MNATKAAERAGYSHTNARNTGARLLANINVREYLNIKIDTIDKKNIADTTEIMEYLTSVMRGESKSEVLSQVGLGNGVTQPKLIKKSPDEKDKLKAAELLGKRYALYTDKQDIEIQLPIILAGEDELED